MKISDMAKIATKTSIITENAVKNEDGETVKPARTIKKKSFDKDLFKFMLKSQGELNKAMATLRLHIKNPKKDQSSSFKSHGQKITYSYSSLAKLIDAIDLGLKLAESNGSKKSTAKQPTIAFNFNSNDKAVPNVPRTVGYGNNRHTIKTVGTKIFVETTIRCSNGWSINIAPVTMVTPGIDPQSIAGCYTYARRYSLSTALGISGRDDTDDQEADSDESQSSTVDVMHQTPATASQLYSIFHVYVPQWEKLNSNVNEDKVKGWLKSNYNYENNMSEFDALKAMNDISSFMRSQQASDAKQKKANANTGSSNDSQPTSGSDTASQEKPAATGNGKASK